MRQNIKNIVMASKKLSSSGIVLAAIFIGIAIFIANMTNPFSSSLPRILYSALIGAIGGGVGVTIAQKLGLTKSSDQVD